MAARHPNANDNQRARRERRPRIDYYPSPAGLAAIEALRTRYGPCNNYSGILNTIIAEWLTLTGRELETAVPAGESHVPEFRGKNARARKTSVDRLAEAPELLLQSRARACARITSEPENRAEQVRVICGARRRSDGQPCQALSVQGKRRCRWHGGCSTGPRTAEGRARSMANLRQYAGRGEGASSPIDPGIGRSANIADW